VSLERSAAALLILLPAAFNVSFFLLARRFDYPDILRQPTDVVLRRFDQGGVGLKLLWFCFMLTAVLFAPLVVVLGQVMQSDHAAVLPTTVALGVLAAAVQFLGLARWPFLVPHLARTYLDPGSSEAIRSSVTITFESLHRYLGVGLGECLGYLLTGAWTVLTGVAMLDSADFAPWLGVLGILIGLLLAIGSLEFVGGHEEQGWKLAGVLVPITYVAWSLWLVTAGIVLLV